MKGSRFLRILLVGALVLACMLAVYGLTLYLGIQSGREAQTELTVIEQAAEVDRQMDIAQADILRGNYQLAMRRLDWVLDQDPENEDAQQLHQEAETALSTGRNPAGESTTTPEASRPSLAKPTTIPADSESVSNENSDAGMELGRLQELANEEVWSELIPALLAFQRTYPSFQRRQTDELLFTAYTTYGVDLLYTDNVELGLYYLRRAEQLGELPQEVADQKLWAELYLGGISYYEVEWETSILFFRELCPAAPFFQNACERLVTALMALADQNVARGEWCPAEPLYAEAFQRDDRPEIANKLALARQGCAGATPTPSSPLTGTLPITGTNPVTGSIPVTGTNPFVPTSTPPVIEGP